MPAKAAAPSPDRPALRGSDGGESRGARQDFEGLIDKRDGPDPANAAERGAETPAEGAREGKPDARRDSETGDASGSEAAEGLNAADAAERAGFRIPGASPEVVAEAKSALGRGLAEIAETARARLAAADAEPDTAAGRRVLRDVTMEVAREVAALAAEIDAATGGDATPRVREALEAAANGTVPERSGGEQVPAPDAVLAIAAGALGVAPPVGRSFAVGPASQAAGAETARTLQAAVRVFTPDARPAALARATDGMAQPVPDAEIASDVGLRRVDAEGRPAPEARPATPFLADRAAPAVFPVVVSDMPARLDVVPDALRSLAVSDPGEALRLLDAARASGAERAIAAHSPSPRLAASVVQQLQDARAAADADPARTRIELSPRGLGTLELDLRTDAAGTTRVVIRAENPMVLDAMRGDRGALDDLMSDGGGGDARRFAFDFEMFGERDARSGDTDDDSSGAGEADPAPGTTTPTATATGQARLATRGLDIIT